MYAFFRKHLNNPGNSNDEETQPFAPDDVRVTTTGQVSTSFGGETVFSLNRKETEKLINALQVSRGDLTRHLSEVLNSVQNLPVVRGKQKPLPEMKEQNTS